jgi:F-type H+-transporting ATPase subunit alpha
VRKEHGAGSLTALPIIQTEAQNISAYIPTNLISITDGQLYLSPELFQKGVLPAVDVGKSVSRVGGKAQLAAYHAVAGNLKLAYSQFEELEMFSRFGTRLDESTRQTLAHGERIRACLKQSQNQLLTVHEQLAVLMSLNAGLFAKIPLDNMLDAQQTVIKAANDIPQEIRNRLYQGQPLDRADKDTILQLLQISLNKLEADHDTNIGYPTA